MRTINRERLLALPIFDDAHREFFTGMNAWLASCTLPHNEISQSELGISCRQIVAALGDAGLTSLTVATEQRALDVRTLCLARQSLAYCSGLFDFVFALQGLGSAPVSLFGSAEQKKRFLPKIARGEWIPAFALSESTSGSDVANLGMTATRDANDFVLNGEKSWISNAGLADFYVVFARTGEAPGARGITAFIIESGWKGVSVSQNVELIAPHPLGTLRLENCRVPVENVIDRCGAGFKVAMGTLDIFRATVGAAALGLACRAVDETIEWVKSRKLFGGALCDLQGTQMRLAEMLTETEASELLIYRAAWLKDSTTRRISSEASMAKMYSTEAAQRTIDSAVQLNGARGVVKGNITERLYREIRAMRIYEGASEVHKVIIAKASCQKLQ